MKEVDTQISRRSMATGRRTSSGKYFTAMTDVLAKPFLDENYAFYGKYLAGVGELKPRWKRCVESTDQLLGEALGQKYVDEVLPAGSQGPREGDHPQHSRGDEGHDQGPRVDDAGDQEEGAGEDRDVQRQDRLSRQVEGLLRRSRSSAMRYFADYERGEVRRWPTIASRSASRSIAAAGA